MTHCGVEHAGRDAGAGTLRPVSCGTDMTVVQENMPVQIPVELCYTGWQESLAMLAALVEAEIP